MPLRAEVRAEDGNQMCCADLLCLCSPKTRTSPAHLSGWSLPSHTWEDRPTEAYLHTSDFNTPHVTHAYVHNKRWITCCFIIWNIQLGLFRVLNEASPNISGVPQFLIKFSACHKNTFSKKASWKRVTHHQNWSYFQFYKPLNSKLDLTFFFFKEATYAH